MRSVILILVAIALNFACAHKAATPEAPAPAPAVSKTAEDLSKPTTQPVKNGDKTECSHDKESRILEVKVKDEGCELSYTKDGKEEVVATGHQGKKHCQRTLEKIEKKLTAAGYTCQ